MHRQRNAWRTEEPLPIYRLLKGAACPRLMGDTIMSINIRKAQPADTTDLANLFLESRRRAFHWKNPTTFQLADFEKETTGEVVSVAVADDQKVVGFISVWEPDRFVHHLFVDANYQRNEIGRLLLSSLTRWLPRPYRLKCVAANLRACEFYRKNGWQEVGRGNSDDGEYLLLEWSGAN